MFKPGTPRIKILESIFSKPVTELDSLFIGKTNVYIDWQNVIHLQDRLGWRLQSHRLYQFLHSFVQVQQISMYTGTLVGNQKSEDAIIELRRSGYCVETKPVKVMPYSIDASSVSRNSPALLHPFIKKPLLTLLKLGTIESLNDELADMNKTGMLVIEDKKCNFDVEIARDIYRDLDSGAVDTFVLWSGDSDFAAPIQEIMDAGKNVVIITTAGRVAAEVSALNPVIFELKKIKEFICWIKDLPKAIQSRI